MIGRASDEVSTTFRRTVLGVLVLAVATGWFLDTGTPSNGFVLMFCALVLGASFFGRTCAVPGAIAMLIALRGDPFVGVAFAVAILLVGERTHHLRRRLGRFAQRSFTDRLTGLFNYDFLQAQVRYEIDRTRRYGGSCSLIVLDLDHFKKFNDTHGHQAANLLLRALADCVKAEKRDSDFAARFGGEEFVVLVPGESRDAMRLAERLREAIMEIELPQLGPEGRVTVSLGIASFPEQATNAAELFERADQA
ncbi:MAG: GGDEF domain-containing protein [Thermoleophilia bacterium]|nr:GGDEF domain-containing protein [Thermoleophilia bacterium]